jgi:internalin A
LPDLERLAFGGTDVTDDSLRLIGELKRVQNLSLIRTRVTGAGLKQLRDMPRLQYLYIPTTVTDEELAELQRLMPNVRISRRSGN